MPPSWKSVLQSGDLVLAAVSGGSDSVGMAARLYEEGRRVGWTLHIVHINHHLEGCLHEEDAAFAAEFARTLGVPFTLLHIHDEELRVRSGESSSLEARLSDERLRLLKEEARRLGACAIALGHTANDAAETFLLMALRGAGPAGLGSMRGARFLETDGLWLLRPLLEQSRVEVQQDLRARGIAWRSDPMNATLKVTRNKLRHRVVPVLEDIDAAAVRSLARAAAACASAHDALTGSVLASCESMVIAEQPGALLLDADALRSLGREALHPALSALWKRAAASHPGAAQKRILPPPGSLVDDLATRLAGPLRERASFGPAGGYDAVAASTFVVLRHGGGQDAIPWKDLLAAQHTMILLDQNDAVPVLSSTQRHTPGRYEIPLPGGQGVLAIDILPAEAFRDAYDSEPYASHRRAALDVRSIRRDLYLRPLDAEARLPIGGGEHKTAAAILQEARVPLDVRDGVAALSDDRGPLWIPAIRRAASAYVTPRTELVLVAEWVPASVPET